MARARPAIAVLLAALCGAAPAAEPLRNWFDDPFFQVAEALPDCPLPAGPFITEAERRTQSHHRAEKGTTCWLAGQCDKPNFYSYDRNIADGLRQAFAQRSAAAPLRATLWVTVQGRVVYIEGCAADVALAGELEALARGVPHVQRAIAALRIDPKARAPYRLMNPRR